MPHVTLCSERETAIEAGVTAIMITLSWHHDEDIMIFKNLFSAVFLYTLSNGEGRGLLRV